MKFTYLALDLCTLVAPLAFSFHPRIGFYRHWRTYLPAMAMSAVAFLLWDALFTHWHVWGFNPRYLSGVYFGNLPLEEWLFFICIPYACVFTTYCLRLATNARPGPVAEKTITACLVGLLLLFGFANLGHRYTATTFLSLALLLACCSWVFKVRWLAPFYVAWLWLLIPLVLVDGTLTGTGLQQPVVWYDPHDILGIRILTIPIEDFLYGMELVLLNITLFDLLQQTRLARRGSRPAIPILDL